MSNYFDHLFSIFDAPQIDTLSQLPRNIVLITSVRTYGGYGFGDRNADGSRILEFADWAKPSHLQYIVHEAGM